jgi:hypothetical protein
VTTDFVRDLEEVAEADRNLILGGNAVRAFKL